MKDLTKPQEKFLCTCIILSLSLCRKMKRKVERASESDDGGGAFDSSSNDLSSPELSPITTGPVHDWEGERTAEKDFFDDGTMTYFW